MQKGAEMSAADFLDKRLKTSHPTRAAEPRLWRDLANDWRRWTALERFLASGLLATLVIVPLATILHPGA
jgi:hypothetical protein